MSVATLMNANDPWFAFEHRMAHERMIDAQSRQSGSTNFSGLPYWIDPPLPDTAVPAGWGNTLHAQAHADFIALFPAQSGGSGIAALNDVSLYPEPDAWWQFSNFQLHYIADQIY